jgi:hypothetical protein
MKILLLILMPSLIIGCSVGPNNTVSYATRIPNRDVKVIYNQRMPNSFGGEEYVDVELADARKFRIDINGRFSEFLHVSISSDGNWYRFYLKDMYPLVGHLEYRDYNNDGELDRHWISKNEDPQNARSHPYAILTFLNTATGKVYSDNRDFGFSTTADRDYFGSKTNLASRQRLLGNEVVWEPMNRQSGEKKKQNKSRLEQPAISISNS